MDQNTNITPPFEEGAHKNRHLVVGIVVTTLIVVAGIVGWSIWSIINTGGSGGPTSTETDAEREARLAAERERALLEQQAADMERMREARGIIPPTAEEISEQAAAMEKLRKQKGITPPTQEELNQQAAEMEALRAVMGQ